ncbi:MAG: type II CRISPR-associated endonuclease Cas1 [Candidatus Fimenecus sp.]
MAWRNIYIASDAKLRLKNNQLIVNDNPELTYPIEDIRSIIVDNPTAVFSGKLLTALSKYSVLIVFCDDTHMPSAQLLPINIFSRTKKRLEMQLDISKPLKKCLWQSIVISKIKNQAKCLKLTKSEKANELYAISKAVKSGDTTNREGYAASVYFKSLFGKYFTRDLDLPVNAALNYGYSILRSYIARTLIAYGFEPALGIHHKSELNAFNFADDLIEPFRPCIDLYVKTEFSEIQTFETRHKAELATLLNSRIIVNSERVFLGTAIEMLIQSIAVSFENKADRLILPELITNSF